MKCPICNGSDFEVKSHKFTPKVKNQLIEVALPCPVCKNCNTPLLDTQHVNHLRRLASDQYRKKHNLYTSKEIIQFRDGLEMSQLQFANYLNVGEASIKRWESYYIQDSSQNDHMRVKCDEGAAQVNHLFLLLKFKNPNLYNGHKKFSIPLFKSTSDFFLKRFPNCSSYLSKLYFYVDFLHFKRFEQSITGSKYLPLKNGPCPYPAIRSINHTPLFQSPEWKKGAFSDQEMETIEDVCDFFDNHGGEKLTGLSRKEKGFLETNETDFISYKYAANLKIK